LLAEFDQQMLLDVGFDDVDFKFAEDIEIDEKDDIIPDDIESICKPGDLWQMGRHRLLCGDAIITADVERLMDGNQADMWLTDPPYNVNYEGKTKDKLKIVNDNKSNEEFLQFLIDAYTSADIVLRPGAVFYIWHADSEGYNFRSAAIRVGWKVRQCLIWNKNSMVMGRQDYHWKHEPCLYGWKEGKHTWTSDRKQTTVLDFDRPNRSSEHPTMKPVEMISYQITNNSMKDNIILDSFAGSGTTLISCEKTGRRCYSLELDPHYCDVIIKRYKEYTGKEATLVE
jgi:DNA modification methylase